MDRSRSRGPLVLVSLAVLLVLAGLTMLSPSHGSAPRLVSVSGRVTLTDGVAADDATVTVSVGSEPGARVLSQVRSRDEDGFYRVRLAAGTYHVRVTAPDVRPVAFELQIGDDALVRDVELSQLSHLVGTVSSSAARPVVGATVIATTRSGSTDQVVSETTVDSDGRYDLTGLPADDYTVMVRADGYPDWWYGDTGRSSEAERVTVPESGSVSADVVLRLADGAVTGTLSAVGDADVPGPGGIDVVLLRDDDDVDQVEYSTRVSAGQPTWRLEVPAGRYRVQFVPWCCYTGPATAVAEWYDEAVDRTSSTVVEVRSGQTTEGVDAALSSGATIAGKVTAPDGSGGRGVTLFRLTDGTWQRSRSNPLRSEHRPDGTYAVGGLRAGTYRVGVLSESGETVEWFGATSDFDAATDVVVGEAETRAGVDIRLDDPEDRGSLRGRVSSRDTGDPMVGVTVRLTHVDARADEERTVVTDDRGYYRLDDAAPGSYLVRVEPDRGYVTTYLGGGYDEATADVVNLRPREDRAALDVAVSSGAHISGRVTGSDGRPVEDDGGYLALPVRVDGVPVDNYTLTADDDGNYEIAGLPAGVYRVQFAAAPGEFGTWWRDSADYEHADDVVLGPDERVVGVSGRSRALGRISGRVTFPGDVPSYHVFAEVRTADGQYVTGVQVQPDGTWATSVAAGTYRVCFSATSDVLGECWLGAEDRAHATSIPVAGGQHVAGIDGAVRHGGTIAGDVADVAGFAPSGRLVVYRQVDGRWEEVYSGFAGDGGTVGSGPAPYRAGPLRPGEYRVGFQTFEPWGVASTSFHGAGGPTRVEDAESVLVTGTSTVDEVDVLVHRPGVLSGTVRGLDGRPRGGVSVSARRIDDFTGDGIHEPVFASTDSNGRYVIATRQPGDYVVRGFAVPGETTGYHGGFDLAHAEPVHVDLDQSVTGVDVAVTASRSIRGRVAEADGAPLAGASITLHAAGPTDYGDVAVRGPVTSGADGSYAVTAPPGSWKIEIRAPGHATRWWPAAGSRVGATPVQIDTTDVTGVDARLVPGATVSGRATTPSGTALPGASVRLYRRSPREPVAETTTDADGAYRFTHVGTGSYAVRVAAVGRAVTWWDVGADLGSARPVELGAATVRSDVDVVLPATHGSSPVRNRVRPVVSGTAAPGGDVQASSGTWTPTPDRFRFQWLVDDQVVPGATAAAYRVRSEDAGHALSVEVTAVVDGLRATSATSTSVDVAPVEAPRVTHTRVPVLRGDLVRGSRVSVDGGGWRPNDVDLAYTWFADDRVVPGARGRSLVLTEDQLGRRLRVEVLATRPGWVSDSASTATSAPVTRPRVTNLEAPTVRGPLTRGSRLTADPGRWDRGDLVFSYQWYADDDLLEDASQSFLVVTAAHEGRRLSVQVTGRKAGWVEGTASSAPTGVVGGPPVATRSPRITGDSRVGGALTVESGTWSPRVVRFSYQWLVDGRVARGRTGRTERVTPGLVGHRLSVRVTAVGSSGAVGAATTGARVVEPGRLRYYPRPPRVLGQPRVGSTLTAPTLRWSVTPGRITYQWLVDGVAARHQVARTYTLGPATRGRAVSLRITASRTGYRVENVTTVRTPRVIAATSRTSARAPTPIG